MVRLKRGDSIGDYVVCSECFGSDAVGLYRVRCTGEQALRLLFVVDVALFGFSGEELNRKLSLFPEVTPRIERIFDFQIQTRQCFCVCYAAIPAEVAERWFEQRNMLVSESDAFQVFESLLKNLRTIHNRDYVLNGFDLGHFLIDMSDRQLKTCFWHILYAIESGADSVDFKSDGRSVFVLSDDALRGGNSVKNDLFSAAAVVWRLLFASYPWKEEVLNVRDGFARIVEIRETVPRIPHDSPASCYVADATVDLLRQVLMGNFDTADEVLTELKNLRDPKKVRTADDVPHENTAPVGKTVVGSAGRGFRDVAGMAQLKSTMKRSVVDILKNPEKARRYKVSIPNGMLLYGPPGCGKSFFAEKFAEETGYGYKLIKSSDVASIYVHGSQQKIAKLFQDAEKHAPCILCFDEFDALVPSRDSAEANHRASEVNEFLSQMNNCSERGIFVVATTNRKELLDPAILRTGRLDFRFYVPPPDRVAREAILRLILSGRPGAESVDVAEIARRTESYVTSDLRYLIDESARAAMVADAELSTDRILKQLEQIKPSVSAEVLAEYSKYSKDDGAVAASPRKIGF